MLSTHYSEYLLFNWNKKISIEKNIIILEVSKNALNDTHAN